MILIFSITRELVIKTEPVVVWLSIAHISFSPAHSSSMPFSMLINLLFRSCPILKTQTFDSHAETYGLNMSYPPSTAELRVCSTFAKTSLSRPCWSAGYSLNE